MSAATETIGAFGLLTVIVWHREAVPFLDHPILLALGRVSYSFYLWHLIVLRVWLRALYGALPAGFESAYALPIAAVSLMLTVSVAIVIAHLSYAYVERPGMKLGAQLASRLQNRSVGTGMVGPRPGARPAA